MKFFKLFVGLVFLIVLSLPHLDAATRSSRFSLYQDAQKTPGHFFEPTQLVRQMLIAFLPNNKYCEKYFDFNKISESSWKDELKRVLRERWLDVNKRDVGGNTLLHHAAYHGDLKLVKLLVYA